jgi:predicted Zn-dependent peptidase
VQKGEFDDYINQAGGMNNANTWYDRTYYYEVLPSKTSWHWVCGSSRSACCMRALTRRVSEAPATGGKGGATSAHGQPGVRPPAGGNTQAPVQSPPVQSIRHRLHGGPRCRTEEDYKTFYKDFYRPDNAILSIAGDLDIDQTKKLIDIYFKDIPRGTTKIERKFQQEPPQSPARCATQCTTTCNFPPLFTDNHIPAQGTEDFYAVKMLGMLLSQGESSRLQKSVVDDQQKAVFAGAFPLELEDPGANICFAIANMGVEVADLDKPLTRLSPMCRRI